jgi:hypothetical protein
MAYFMVLSWHVSGVTEVNTVKHNLVFWHGPRKIQTTVPPKYQSYNNYTTVFIKIQHYWIYEQR